MKFFNKDESMDPPWVEHSPEYNIENDEPDFDVNWDIPVADSHDGSWAWQEDSQDSMDDMHDKWDWNALPLNGQARSILNES